MMTTSKPESPKIQEDNSPTECSTITSITNKSRPLFSRNHGYQLVKRKEEDEMEFTHPTAWITKSSTYSLLSNVSTDSFMSELEDRAQNLVKLDNNVCLSRRPGQVRSESVQNFREFQKIPRSLTTVRFNPFDPNKEMIRVQRDETLDFTTSDYASEIDEPFNNAFVGISNPVYTEFSACVADGEDLLGEHRNFAQALNPSLLSKNSRSIRLRNDVLTQLHRLQHIVNDKRASNIVSPNSSNGSCSEVKHGLNSFAHNEECWSILMLGGREPVQLTVFDRPLSIWMFRM